MSIYPTHHWPPPEPPEFVPDGGVPLFEAFNLVGKALCGDDWADGKELGARPAQEIPDRDKILEKLKGLPPVSEESRAAAITRRIALPPRFPTIEAEILAHERGDKIWDQLLQWLYSQQVPATILDSQGHQYVLPINVWAAVDARLILHTGKKRLGSKSGDVLLSREHLEAAIEKEEVAKGGNSVAGQDTAPAEIDRSPPKRGRRPKYDWQSFDAQVVAIAH